MYYSCLQGSWDADNNDIFGEETDEVDYFPEVFVSRIPVNSIEEIEDYISRLISYESGEIADYNKAAGFSMALWPGSDSEICQQYIYDMYFPDDYYIQFLWSDENTQEAAYELMNDGQNIVQHTGHAGRQSMSLENGRIRLDDIDSLHNEWGGLFYSIGCWSAAIDYNSIGENLVSQIDRGFLGYVGNSRYGWGAPAASGFGFSEFFQKAFFLELFTGNTRLAETNALQKLEFIPYFGGTSVYKWVAYELNALGDSYLNLNISNPEEMNYSLVLEGSEYHIVVSDAYGPLENVNISGSVVSVVTDMTGEAVIPVEIGESELTLFKSGYKTQFIELPAGTDNFLLDFTQLPEDLNFIQGETFSLGTEFINFTDQEQWFRLVCDYNPGEITLDCNMDTQLAPAGSSVDLDDIIIGLNSIADSYQMRDGKEIFLNINIFSATGNYLLSERKLSFTVAAPDLQIQQFYLDAETLLPGSQIPLGLELINTGTDDIFGFDIEYLSASSYLEFENNSFHIDSYLMPGDGLLLNNFINVDGSAPSSLLAEFQVICRTYWQEQLYVFENSLFFTTGQIGFTDEFDNVEMWELDPEWQLVNTTYFSEQYSLSCRPEYVGCYRAESPLLNYLPGLEVLFQYKYKMPMYGNDGVYVLLETENTVDTLLFLGAGGALLETERTPQIYIESDWAEYQLSLDDILLNTPDPGTQFSIALQFTVPEIFDGFNEYSLMQDIGVFFDSFFVGQQREKPDPPHNDVLQIYPNPSSAAGLPRFSAYSRGEYPLKMKIYDIKGKLIRQEKYQGLGDGRIELFWNGKDEWGKPAASGLYIIIIDTGVKKYRDKFIYFN